MLRMKKKLSSLNEAPNICEPLPPRPGGTGALPPALVGIWLSSNALVAIDKLLYAGPV